MSKGASRQSKSKLAERAFREEAQGIAYEKGVLMAAKVRSMNEQKDTERKPYGNKLGKVMWVNGKLVPSEEVKVHITAHSLHYGLGAFEGIRAYELKDKKI